MRTAAGTGEREAADELEERYSALFHGAGIPIWESDWSGPYDYLAAEARARGVSMAELLRTEPEVSLGAVPSARVTLINDAALELYDIGTEGEILGRSLGQRYSALDGIIPGALMQALAEGKAVAEAEGHIMTSAGTELDVVLRVAQLPSPIPWKRIFITALDVTARNEAERRFQRALGELAHASRVSMLGQMAASIAHEVNQPLAAIINFAESGKRWLARGELEEARRCFEGAAQHGHRAAEVVAGIRAMAARGAPQTVALDLPALVGEAVALARRELRDADVAVRYDMEPGLPAVRGDKVQIEQIVLNLVLNAAQAMAGVQGNRDLVISLRRDRDMVRAAFRDTGTGIALENPDAIFEAFFTTKGEGMGMGLSLCRSIVEAHGGRIGAANNPEGGATISFSLPVAEDAR